MTHIIPVLERPKRRHKFNVSQGKEGKERRTVEGIVFHSEKEAKRFWELRQLEKAGKIAGLKRQKRYEIAIRGIHICDYVLDFFYYEPTGIKTSQGEMWLPVHEDSKGKRTREYEIKKALMNAVFHIEIRET